MAHYEEKQFRVAKSQAPVTSELKVQLATLKCDLAHFQSSRASSLLMESLKERIRQIESHLAREAEAKPRPAPPVDDGDSPAAYYATSARYAARPRRST